MTFARHYTAVPSRDMGLLAAFVDAIPQPVVVLGAEMRVAAVNAPALQVLPTLRIGDLLAWSLRDPTVLDAVRRVDKTAVAERVTWRDRVPVERIFAVAVAALRSPDHEDAVVLTLHDLTEARRVERMRADFIANASHELRTPLASVLGFIDTLQGPARDDAAARGRFLAIMAEQARRMARLVDDLLSLSRIEQRRHIRPSLPVDLSRLVGHVADTLMPMAQESDVALRLDVQPGVVVAGDRDELVRVAENLIENAIKYGRRPRADDPPPGIDVRVFTRRDAGVLVVRDHGEGIAPEHLPRLTERFYRIDAGQSRAKGGTGLGLALVKHIVAHHRGRFTFDSILGEGSTFSVAIPLHAENLSESNGVERHPGDT